MLVTVDHLTKIFVEKYMNSLRHVAKSTKFPKSLNKYSKFYYFVLKIIVCFKNLTHKRFNYLFKGFYFISILIYTNSAKGNRAPPPPGYRKCFGKWMLSN